MRENEPNLERRKVEALEAIGLALGDIALAFEPGYPGSTRPEVEDPDERAELERAIVADTASKESA